MDAIADYMAIIAARAEAANSQNPDDYIEDGLLICGKCRTPKQCRPFADKSIAVSCVCRCGQEYDEQLKAIRTAGEIEHLRESCFRGYDGTMKDDRLATFGADDAKDSPASKAVRGYAKHPDGWLLLCGNTGTGKSYYASCICNALVDKGWRCKFTGISEIADALFSAEDKASVYADLSSHSLVVIDDLGAERGTEYMREITFRVIDQLLRSGVHVVITTNKSLKEMMNEQDTDLQRIYSRICKAAIPIPVTGKDRRREELISTARGRMQKLIEEGENASEDPRTASDMQ